MIISYETDVTAIHRTKRVLIDELNACSSTRNLQRGKEIHAEAIESGYVSCNYLATALVKMYSKCGSMADALKIFEIIKYPDVVSWTALIMGYAKRGDGTAALNLFSRMRYEGCAPNSFTFVAVLKACASMACLKRGKQIHSIIGCHSDIHVLNALIYMYVNCRRMAEARLVFDSIKIPDVVSWSTLILGYAENGEGAVALDLFVRMKSQGCTPNSFTFVAALTACIFLAHDQDRNRRAQCLERGKEIHSQIGCCSDIYVQNTLIDMYGKCGSMPEARKVFDSISHPGVVAWTALILGYADNGEGRTALDLFEKMRSQGCAPNSITVVAALKACTSLALHHGKEECLDWAKRIHSEVSCHSDICVKSSLIDTYAKCGGMLEAHQVFDTIRHPDVVAWTALLLGYAENGEGAFDLFTRMKSEGCAPDSLILVAVLKSCSMLGAFEFGSIIHAEMDMDIADNAVLVTTLVDFYAKCGKLVEAQKVFDSHPIKRDLRTWTALLSGYSRLGDIKSVFRLFQQMQDVSLQPDGVTLLSILTCCTHAGLVEKAEESFKTMSSKYGISPGLEHYTCMVDVFGRSNRLDDAMALLRNIPCVPDVVTWMTILAACHKWRKKMGIGRLVFTSLVTLDDTYAPAYVLMGHIYGSWGMWEEQSMVLGMRRKLKTWKEPGKSCWANERGGVHTFLVQENKAT